MCIDWFKSRELPGSGSSARTKKRWGMYTNNIKESSFASDHYILLAPELYLLFTCSLYIKMSHATFKTLHLPVEAHCKENNR